MTRWTYKLLLRLRSLFRKSRVEGELDDEIRFHLENQIEEYIEQGMTPQEARYTALRELGGVEQHKEECRDMRGLGWLDEIRQDLRYGTRTLAKNPGFAAVGLLVLALGIGVNTAIFSIINAVLFRPLPVRAPDELMYLYSHDQRSGLSGGLSYDEYQFVKENSGVFKDMLARDAFSQSGVTMRLTVNGETDQAGCEFVTANYFEVLGIEPMLGRTFGPEEDREAGFQPVAVISYGLWKSRFNLDPEILGKSIQVKGLHYGLRAKSFTIIGVTKPEFSGLANPWSRTQVWAPLVQWCEMNKAEDPLRYNLRSVGFYAVARLKPGITREQARAVMGTIGHHLQQEFHPKDPDWSLILRDSKNFRLPFDTSYKVVPARLAAALMAVTGIVLLIAAANLAGILMARVLTRRGEIAARLALGASRGRIIRQLLTESMLLSIFGGTLGLLLARLLVSLFIAGTPSQFSHFQFSMDVPLDFRVLLFMGIVCVAAGVLVGLIPAIQASGIDIVRALAGGGIVASRRVHSRLRYWIVVPQVCLSLVLLLMAAVLIKILVQAEFIDAGYDSEHLAFIEYAMPYPRALLEELGRAPKTVADLERIQAKARELREKRNLSDRRLLERARANPDFTAVALTDSLPLNPVHAGIVEREDFYKTKQLRWVSTASVSPDYFQVLGISVLRGRLFDERDIIAEPRRVVIVCEALAGMLWPGQNPIGRYLAFSWPGSTLPPQWLEVVGVVNEVKPPLSGGGPNPFLYVPLGPGSSGAEFLLARGYESPSRLVKGLTASINEANPAVEIVKGQTMSDAIREALYPRRMAGAMLAVSGIIGLLLASVGIYGVVSYSVAQRFKEIGIRAALGARKNNILKLVIGEGVKVAMLGSFLGLPLAIAAIRITSHFVVQFPTIDWMTMIAVPAFLGAVILLACYFPARRAARVDPMVALREL